MLEHDTVQTLERLTQVSVQGEQGFSTCARQAADPELAALLRACARQCHDAAHELRELTRLVGGDAALSIHAPNDALQRSRHGWGAAGAQAEQRDDRAVLAQCQHAGEVARAVYGDALAHTLPANVYRLVAAQYQGVLATCQRLNARRQELLRH